MIRPATPADIPQVSAIYEEILTNEEQTKSYTNWVRGVYPTAETARNALKEGWLYVLEEDGLILATAILNHVQLPEYKDIPWQYPGQGDEIFVIHTLCVPPSRSGRGLARRFVAFAEGLAAGKWCRAMRLDTYEGNAPAAAFYPKLGYRLAGETEFFFEGFRHEVLICFEKDLTKR